MKKTKGFTLMEMMVVVLIIATLSAIAYPMYTKAIVKARLTEALSLAEIVREAEQRSLAMRGHYFYTFSNEHISGSTRLIKSNDVSLRDDNKKLVRGLYTVQIPPGGENNQARCVQVLFGEDDNNPIFTVTVRIEDSRIWCSDVDDGSICNTIPSLEEGDPDCQNED